MSEKQKDLKRQIDELRDVDDSYTLPSTAARLDLFMESDSAELSSIPEDSLVNIISGDKSYIFHKPEVPPSPGVDGVEEWAMISEGDNGKPIETPVLMIGSAVNTNGTFMEAGKPTFRKGHPFIFGIIHRFKEGSEEGVPNRFSLFPSPETLDPAILEENLRMSLVVKGEDGELYWQTVTEQALPQVDKVNSVSIEGAEAHLK